VKALTSANKAAVKLAKDQEKQLEAMQKKLARQEEELREAKLKSRGRRRRKSHSAHGAVELESLLVTLNTPPQILNLKQKS
jgi:hypothetical protein